MRSPWYDSDNYDLDDFDPETDDPYDYYDPKRWPDWRDFLDWLRRLLGELLDWLFGNQN